MEEEKNSSMLLDKTKKNIEIYNFKLFAEFSLKM